MPVPTIEWDSALIRQYNQSGPRYTSYPTALEFSDGYGESAFRQALMRYPQRPLSLYLHIPFCHKLCYFCACNKIITRQTEKVDRYLAALEREIAQRAPLFRQRPVVQMHWGGGTPTYLTREQITRLVSCLREHFAFQPGAELSLEIDPRQVEPDIIDFLAEQGFNRISMGVQDFNKNVQRLVNRVQDEDLIFTLMARAKECGFQSTNIDLIYGLPQQTPATFLHTLKRVIALNPQRLSVFNYAHLPALFAAQRKIKQQDLPDAASKLTILQQTIATLCEAGYQFIGMDHFARPDDELAVAQRAGKLHRNFQGYTTRGDCELLGMGVSAISMIGDSYAQNQKDIKSYTDSVDRQGNGLWRGVSLTQDDCLRRDIIKGLICQFAIDYAPLEQQYGIRFSEYFAEDLNMLAPMERDGLVTVTERAVNVSAKGRLLIRNICMCFDRYLRDKMRQRQFSQVI
ncbi:oxygen-independent coproporphyrinogen III oxidase [Martelella alba]|uniref:Coproporphyrinogen-III oxidase n=1 Tax=Martelella alba TaxID=2590451 RepID=A0ABY2SGI6_9HYPH|nr:oxygen-independent coproporphyrinogen III oxidase [Martelella alba]TKI04260.1 oxygen-independent coproporphyrinogen III oxidase [Martelella alba]